MWSSSCWTATAAGHRVFRPCPLHCKGLNLCTDLRGAGSVSGAASGHCAGPVRDSRLRQCTAEVFPQHPGAWHAQHPPQPAAAVARRSACASCTRGACWYCAPRKLPLYVVLVSPEVRTAGSVTHTTYLAPPAANLLPLLQAQDAETGVTVQAMNAGPVLAAPWRYQLSNHITIWLS